ncbi:hypothetical protein ACFPFR_03645 [Corynebacterium aquatimens]
MAENWVNSWLRVLLGARDLYQTFDSKHKTAGHGDGCFSCFINKSKFREPPALWNVFWAKRKPPNPETTQENDE